MWILFAPSEKKCIQHTKETKPQKKFYKNFICQNLEEILKAYVWFLQTASEAEIQKLFGKKTLNLQELSTAQNLLDSPLLEAISRYIGVAFSALNFNALNPLEKAYLREHLLIFSNLFGLLRAEDKIPYYDLKQGEGFKDTNFTFSTKQLYAKNLENIWKFLLQNYPTDTKRQNKESLEILDLRAGFYQKCFTITNPPKEAQNIIICTPSFIKNGKVLSHYAKFYRGILLKACAQFAIPNLSALLELEIPNLTLQSQTQTHTDNSTHILLTYSIKDS